MAAIGKSSAFKQEPCGTETKLLPASPQQQLAEPPANPLYLISQHIKCQHGVCVCVCSRKELSQPRELCSKLLGDWATGLELLQIKFKFSAIRGAAACAHAQLHALLRFAHGSPPLDHTTTRSSLTTVERSQQSEHLA